MIVMEAKDPAGLREDEIEAADAFVDVVPSSLSADQRISVRATAEDEPLSGEPIGTDSTEGMIELMHREIERLEMQLETLHLLQQSSELEPQIRQFSEELERRRTAMAQLMEIVRH